MGVALLSSMPGSAWAQTATEVAAANPRIRAFDNGAVGLPRPLSTVDAQLMRRLFADQAAGLPPDPNDLKALHDDALLRGSLLADRFLRQPKQTNNADLRAWLNRYGAQPEAPAIRRLLLAKSPHPAAPASSTPPSLEPARTDAENQPASLDQPRNLALEHDVHNAARLGHADVALRMISRTRGLSAAYGAQLRAEVAQILFTQGADSRALDIALAAHRQAGGRIGLAPFIGGLAEWRQVRPEAAARLFETAANASLASPALRSAASFWAARAQLRAGNPAAYHPLMRRAAADLRTFYGLLARRALGLGIGFAADNDTLGEADVDAVAAYQAGQRAFALLQIGRDDAAEAELRTIWSASAGNAALGRSLLLVARAADLTGLAAQLASLELGHDGRLRDDAHYPLPPLTPHGGFRVDPALVYALIRMESNFDPSAVSAAGARGLMQVMPLTASYLAEHGVTPRQSAGRLHEPSVNLEIGQRYVQYLSRQSMVDGDLIRLLASYNAGPATVDKWVADGAETTDPLLFIEAIPFDETRSFVHRVLASSWLYAARLNLPANSLDELAAGAWPRFNNVSPPAGWRSVRVH